MRILYVAMKYDYGRPERGHSFEHHNFYHSLVNMGHDIIYFDFLSLMQQRGREWMNRRLAEVAGAEKPDLLFCVLFKEELDRDVVRAISESGKTVALNWFCDDHWRFESFTSRWAPCFNWVVTTATSALPKYERIGCANVIKSQWACNHFLYRKLDLPLAYDVTFVGLPHGNRRQVIDELRRAGLNVKVWGQGWESGRQSQEEMIAVFNQSRINLNLGNASTFQISNTGRVLRGVRQLLSGALDALPGGARLKAAARANTAVAGTVAGLTAGKYCEQIKGRNFEVPGCGGFLLTSRADNLEDYYTEDQEVACFTGAKELVAKARHYLADEEVRAAIARAGHERTLREHTYAHRFTEIFGRLGLPTAGIADVLQGRCNLGQTQEIV